MLLDWYFFNNLFGPNMSGVHTYIQCMQASNNLQAYIQEIKICIYTYLYTQIKRNFF